ncbi:MAG TPA: CDP-glycerol glycerophosphotransferase family protein [Candidatus Limnocylindrales bacterium]|nr:CDP-glycerol glycerophosphotransferase family protein [Candidatus Limnocylindrales bacterium]
MQSAPRVPARSRYHRQPTTHRPGGDRISTLPRRRSRPAPAPDEPRPSRRRRILGFRIALVRLGFFLGRRLPLQSHVVLASTAAEQPAGNLAFIRAELDRRTPRIPYVLLMTRPATDWRRWFATFSYNLRAGYHLARARLFIVDDYYFPIYVITPRAGTTIVQTWHASGAFKKIGWSVLDKTFGADEALVERVAIHSNYDICLMASKTSAVHYAEAFHQPLERFVTDLGMPRTDVLFGPRVPEIVAAVRAKYGLPAGRKVVLYAPTFRGTTVRKATSPQDLDFRELHRVLGDDHVILLKLHPFVREAQAIPPELRSFAIDASDHPDIHELMLASDILVTDYSSAIFEFSLLGRPMAFFAPDHDDYLDERGFYFDYRTGVPGPVFETTTELAQWLRAGRFDLDRVERFRADAFEIADGHATERFVDRIVLPALR